MKAQLELPHLLTIFEIQKYYQNQPTFNGVLCKKQFTKIKDGGIRSKS